jgi:hypothetical protein
MTSKDVGKRVYIFPFLREGAEDMPMHVLGIRDSAGLWIIEPHADGLAPYTENFFSWWTSPHRAREVYAVWQRPRVDDDEHYDIVVSAVDVQKIENTGDADQPRLQLNFSFSELPDCDIEIYDEISHIIYSDEFIKNSLKNRVC